ncbi:MAG: metal-dependent hydrolase, beta-lactamase superfamily [Actinomycetia bacterium]|nr:metal-dependent hydrolase, beta-lactamase superfamily [Actinomycetes bacterium]
MSGGFSVGFWGVRGSTPCEGSRYQRYGGHSSCVTLEAEGQSPVILDLGTGLRPYGESMNAASDAFHGSVLLTHLHWDHVQGLPFFTPLHCEGASLDVFGPRQEAGLSDVFTELMRPPFFPIRPEDLAGDVRFHDTGDDDFPLGQAKVRSRWVRHVGPTLGFRIDWNGASVAYIPDHGPGCCPEDPDDYVPHEVLELCDGVDLLVHDAQHTASEWGPKRHWGHCTADYAVHVARESGARRLALFHHDPGHGDDAIDVIKREANDFSARIGGPEVVAAYEGMCVTLDPHAPRS